MVKTSLLVWSDYACSTGFSSVSSNILSRLLSDQFDIDILGINYDGRPDYNHSEFPGRIWPACSANSTGPYQDLLGRQKLCDLLFQNDYDTLFIIQDTFNVAEVMPYIIKMRRQYNKKFKIIYYFPIDATPEPGWIHSSVEWADVPVAYTEYAFNEVIRITPGLASRMTMCLHGVDTKKFYPMDNKKRLKSELFSDIGDRRLLVNINRNQPRKDIERSLMVLKELNQVSEQKYFLYLHMSNQDIGGNLDDIAMQIGLAPGVDYRLADKLGYDKRTGQEGYTTEEMNMIYNAADCLITTTTGEGFGLSLIEAMATKTPVVAPNHTSISEILSDSRGYLCRSGLDDPSLWAQLRGDNRLLRPLVDVKDMVYNIESVFNAPKEKQIRVDNAYKWAVENDWDNIVSEFWQPILLKNEV